jgi:hypothetical protein
LAFAWEFGLEPALDAGEARAAATVITLTKIDCAIRMEVLREWIVMRPSK